MGALVVALAQAPSLVRTRLAAAHGERGATATEYALLAALVAGVVVLAVATFGGEVLTLFQSADDALPSV